LGTWRVSRTQCFLRFRAGIHRVEFLSTLIAVVVVESLRLSATLIRGPASAPGATKGTGGAFHTLVSAPTPAPATAAAACRAISLRCSAGRDETFNRSR
jgi:hypothetical protein